MVSTTYGPSVSEIWPTAAWPLRAETCVIAKSGWVLLVIGTPRLPTASRQLVGYTINPGILARPNAIQELLFHSKFLTSVVPFHNAKESINGVFNPALGRSQLTAPYASKFDALFVRVHALIFERNDIDTALIARSELCNQFVEQTANTGPIWKEQGVIIVVTCISAWFSYGA